MGKIRLEYKTLSELGIIPNMLMFTKHMKAEYLSNIYIFIMEI